MGTRKLVTGVVSVAVVALLGFSIFRALTAGPADVPRADRTWTTRSGRPRPGGRGTGLPPAARQHGRDLRPGHRGARRPRGEGRVAGAGPGAEDPGQGGRPGGRGGACSLELASDAERAAVAAAKADLEAAGARLAISSLTARRAEELARDGVISRDERDRSVSQANIDRAGVDQARSRLSEAQARLAQLSIKAPSMGTILKLSVREGEYYSPEGGASLVTLGNLSKVRVRLDIDERFIGSVFVGQPGYVVVEAYDRKFPGKVVEIAQRMGRKNQRTDDPTERIDTKIREVVLELDDARELVPGLRATGYLSETNLESSSKVSNGPKGQKGRVPPTVTGRASTSATSTPTSASTPGEGDAAGWSDRGAAAAAQGNWKEAVQSYERALRLAPSEPAILAGLGIAYANTRQFAQAIPVLQKASLAIRGCVTGRRRSCGWPEATWRSANTREGLERAQQAAALAPRDAQAPYWKARAYSGMGRFEEARTEANAALDLDNTHAGARAVRRALDERAKAQRGGPPPRPGGGSSLEATASVTTGARRRDRGRVGSPGRRPP